MVRRCCILTCKNGHSSCDEKVTFFKAPSKPTLFEKWSQAVAQTGSPLYKTSSICERHFREEEIRREAVLRDSFGNVIFQRPLIKFALSKEAVPSIFEKDFEGPPRKLRKRRSAAVDGNKNFANGDYRNNSDLNNILITFHENQSATVHYNITSNTPQEGTMLTNIEADTRNNEHQVTDSNSVPGATSNRINEDHNSPTSSISNGNKNGYNHRPIRTSDQQTSIVEIIYMRSQESVNNSNDIENDNSDNVSSAAGQSIMNREQASPNEINNVNSTVTTTVPNDDIVILDEVHESNKKTKAKPSQPKKNAIPSQLPESEIQINRQIFDIIYHNSHKIRLPSPMWGYHKNNVDKDIIVFSKARWLAKSGVAIPPIYEKQVIFHESEEIKIYINNKFSPLEVRRPKDILEMELILKSVDEIIICSGGPNVDECDTASCAQKDYAVSRWRHKLCPIVIPLGQTICNFCVMINQVLRYPKKKKLPFGRESGKKKKKNNDD